jgi:hypothetical protein
MESFLVVVLLAVGVVLFIKSTKKNKFVKLPKFGVGGSGDDKGNGDGTVKSKTEVHTNAE